MMHPVGAFGAAVALRTFRGTCLSSLRREAGILLFREGALEAACLSIIFLMAIVSPLRLFASSSLRLFGRTLIIFLAGKGMQRGEES